MLTWPLHRRRKHLQFSRKNTLKTQKSFSTAGQLEGISVIPTTASSCWQLPTPEQQQGLADRPHCHQPPGSGTHCSPQRGRFQPQIQELFAKVAVFAPQGCGGGQSPLGSPSIPMATLQTLLLLRGGRSRLQGLAMGTINTPNSCSQIPQTTLPLASMELQRFPFLILGFGWSFPSSLSHQAHLGN